MFELKKTLVNGKQLQAVFLVVLVGLVVFSSVPWAANAADNVADLNVSATLSFSDEPTCVAFNEQTNQVYVGTENGVVVVNGENDTVVSEIALADHVGAIVVNPQTNLVYVGTWSNVTVLDARTNLVVGTIMRPVYNYYELALNPNTGRLYIGDWTTVMGRYDSVQVYDALNFSLIATIDIPTSNNNTHIQRVGVAVNLNTNVTYVTWTGNNSTYVIDENNKIVATAQTSLFDVAVKFNNNTNFVYVGGTVLNGTDLGLVASNFTGQVEAIDLVNNLLYATQDFSVFCLNGTTHAVLSALRVDLYIMPSLDPMGVNQVTSKAYLVDYVSQQLLVIRRGN
jgi:hypothetical protein